MYVYICVIYFNVCIARCVPSNHCIITGNFELIIFCQENPFQNVTCKMAAILPRPQCVHSSRQVFGLLLGVSSDYTQPITGQVTSALVTEHSLSLLWARDIKRTLVCITHIQATQSWLTCNRTWWRHQIEIFSALLAICAGNSPVPGEFPTQRPMTQTFDFFFDLRLNNRLSKQSWGWWFETLSCPLRRHRNEIA